MLNRFFVWLVVFCVFGGGGGWLVGWFCLFWVILFACLFVLRCFHPFLDIKKICSILHIDEMICPVSQNGLSTMIYEIPTAISEFTS